jgi:hypothetical protein
MTTRFALAPIRTDLVPLRERGLDFEDPRAFRFAVPEQARDLILVQEDCASPEECKALVDIYVNHHRKSPNQVTNVFRSPVLWSTGLLDAGYLAEWRQIQRLKARIIAAAKVAFHLDELFVEADVINRMLPGEVHVEHSDNSDYLCAAHGDHRWVDGDCSQGTWVPMSDRWWRDISAVLYLNDEFEGGTLRFEQYDLELHPRPGMVTVFPSNRTFLHHVTPVTSGVRYAMPLWLTRDWQHQNP